MAKRGRVFSLTTWDQVIIKGFLTEAEREPERREELMHVIHAVIMARLAQL